MIFKIWRKDVKKNGFRVNLMLFLIKYNIKNHTLKKEMQSFLKKTEQNLSEQNILLFCI